MGRGERYRGFVGRCEKTVIVVFFVFGGVRVGVRVRIRGGGEKVVVVVVVVVGGTQESSRRERGWRFHVDDELSKLA